MSWSRTLQRSRMWLRTRQTASAHLWALEWNLMKCDDSNSFYNSVTCDFRHCLFALKSLFVFFVWFWSTVICYIMIYVDIKKVLNIVISDGDLGKIYGDMSQLLCVFPSGWAAGRAGEAGEESGWESLWEGPNGGESPLSQSDVRCIASRLW